MEIQNPFQVVWEKVGTTNFAEFFFKKIAKYGAQHAVIDFDTGKQWRFSEIKQFAETCTARLREIGVDANSRVAVITSTTAQAVFVFLANAIIGSTVVCINGFSTTDELWQQVDLSEATHCVTESQFVSRVEEVKKKASIRGGGRIKIVKTLEEVLGVQKLTLPLINKRESKVQLLVKEDSQLSILNNRTSTPSSEIVDEDEDKTIVGISDIEAEQPKTPLFIFFSSGTTGLPKAIVISHQSLIVNMMQISLPIYSTLSQKDRFLLPISIHHLFGTISVFYALLSGSNLILMAKYSPKTLLQAIDEQKITQSHMTPLMIQMLAIDPIVKNYNLSTLQSIVVSGAPLDKNIAELCRQKLELKHLRQAYGMTELCGICTLSPHRNENIASVGVPLPGMLFKIIHWETNQLCEPNQIGQLHAIGPQVLPVFYRNPRATTEIFNGRKMVKTGDAGYYDQDGYIYVIGRIKDLIKYKNTLICPSEVEAVMRTHPGIDDCAVVGRQDHATGEVPAAFVVRNPNYPNLSSAEVRQHVSGKISQFKELRGGVYFVLEIPRTTCGKILRRQLKQHWDRERTMAKSDNVAVASGQNSPLNGSPSGKSRRSSNAVGSGPVKNSVNQKRTRNKTAIENVFPNT